MIETLDADIVFLSGYTCPGCLAELELPHHRPDSWLRCPRCGRPSLPPTMENAATPAQVWGQSTAEILAGTGPSPLASSLSRIGLIVAPILLVVALAVDVVIRLSGLDENARMVADCVAFLSFGALILLGLRAILRG